MLPTESAATWSEKPSRRFCLSPIAPLTVGPRRNNASRAATTFAIGDWKPPALNTAACTRTNLVRGPSRPYNPTVWHSLPVRASASTRSPRRSAKAGWAVSEIPSPSNARVPVNISNSTAPKAHTSLLPGVPRIDEPLHVGVYPSVSPDASFTNPPAGHTPPTPCTEVQRPAPHEGLASRAFRRARTPQ